MKKIFFLSLCLWACTPLPPEALNRTSANNSNGTRPLQVQASASALPSPRPTPVPSGTNWPANWQPVVVAPTPTPHREFFPTSAPTPTPTPIPASPQPERPPNLAQGLVAHFPFENTLESINNPVYSDTRPLDKLRSTISFDEGIRGQAVGLGAASGELPRIIPNGNLGEVLTQGFSFSVWCKMGLDNTDPNNPKYTDLSHLLIGGTAGELVAEMPFAFYWTPGGAELILNYTEAPPVRLFLNRRKNPRPEVQNDQWQHWAVSYDLKTINIYFNGKLDLTQAYTHPIKNMHSSKVMFVYSIGSLLSNIAQYGYSFGFSGGDMDELRIYNRALNPEEVQQLYEYK